MSFIVLGHPEAHEKLTAKLYWKRVADTGYYDAGNVRDYVDASSRSLVVRSRTAQGARHVNDEQADTNHESYSFLLDERVPHQELLLKLARLQDAEIQSSTEGATATLASVTQGKSYPIGGYNIENVSVTGSSSGLAEEDVDYTLDAPNGVIKIISGGGIATGETVILTFDQPRIAFEKSESQRDPLFYCDIIIEEHNQYHKMWLRRMLFRGYLNVTEFPSQTGEFATYRVKVTPSGPVTTMKRPEADDIVAADFSSETSSSSSSSTAYSYTSSSSSSTAVSYTSSSSSSSSSSSQSSSSSSSTAFSQTSSSSTPSSVSSDTNLTVTSSSSQRSNESSSSTAYSYTSSSSSSTVASNTSGSSSSSSSSSSTASSSSSTAVSVSSNSSSSVSPSSTSISSSSSSSS